MECSKRKSVESPPRQLTPTPPLSPKETSPGTKFDYKAAYASSECLTDLKVDFGYTLYFLVRDGIIPDRDSLLRSDESFKKSWEISLQIPISMDGLYPMVNFPPYLKEKIEEYFDDAADNEFFDVTIARPIFMQSGFFVIYPEDEEQKDPVIKSKPQFKNVVYMASKLGRAAVEFHNIMTGSNLLFSKMKKANLLLFFSNQYYFITLEAVDDDTGKEVTCRSRVVCGVPYNQWNNTHGKPMPINATYVDSFHVDD